MPFTKPVPPDTAGHYLSQGLQITTLNECRVLGLSSDAFQIVSFEDELGIINCLLKLPNFRRVGAVREAKGAVLILLHLRPFKELVGGVRKVGDVVQELVVVVPLICPFLSLH